MTEQATRWAVRVTHLSTTEAWVRFPQYTLVSRGERSVWRDKTSALASLWQRRRDSGGETYKLVRITRKPRLSPEVVAARDALCKATVAAHGKHHSTDEATEFGRAADAYVRAARK